MKTNLFFAATFLSALFTHSLYSQSKAAFSYKVYGNIANYFENEQDLLGFFEFKKGDVVVEIGAATGENVVGLSLLTDSITFYAEDIDLIALNKKNFDKEIKKRKKYKKINTNTFEFVIGTEKFTNLPDQFFDKIILSATFHEFTYMDEMIEDMRKKLQPGGRIYILESICLSPDHKNYTAEQTIDIMKKHGFKLVKKDGKDLNESTGLYRVVFELE